MMRSSFFSAGLFVMLVGVTLLFVDRVVLNVKEEVQRDSGFRGLFTSVNTERQRIVDPPEWAAFSLMSVGSVTMLYSAALPKKKPE